MMVWRLVSNFRASEEILAPVVRSSSTDCRSSPERRCGRPGCLPSAMARRRPAWVRSMRRSPLEFRHRIDHVHGELARRTGEIDTAERQAVNPDAGLGEACHRGSDIHGVAPEAVELGDDQDISGLEPVGEPFANSGRWLMATLPEMVSVTMRCGSTRKPEAVISCTWFSVVCSGVETLRYAKVLAIVLPCP